MKLIARACLLAQVIVMSALGVMSTDERVSFKEPETIQEAARFLEVSEKDSPEVVKAAYIKLQRKYHPDQTAEDKQKAEIIVKKVNNAYKFFKDLFEGQQSQQKTDAQKRVFEEQMAALQKGKAAAAQKKPVLLDVDSLLRQLASAQVKVFYGGNFVKDGISAEKIAIWYEALANVQLYVQTILKKQRSFGQGISASDQTNLQSAVDFLLENSDRFIGDVNVVSLTFKEGPINHKMLLVKDLFPRVCKSLLHVLRNMREETLATGFLDISDVKDARRVLSNAFSILERAVESALEKLS